MKNKVLKLSMFLLLTVITCCHISFAAEEKGAKEGKEARECKSKEDNSAQSGEKAPEKNASEDACKDNGEFKEQEKDKKKAKDQCKDDVKPCCCKPKEDAGKGGAPAFPPIPDIPCGSDEKKTGFFKCEKVCKKMKPPQMDRDDGGKGCMPICEPPTPERNPVTKQCMGTPYVPPLPIVSPRPVAGSKAPNSGVKK